MKNKTLLKNNNYSKFKFKYIDIMKCKIEQLSEMFLNAKFSLILM